MAEREEELTFHPPQSVSKTWLGVVLVFLVFALFVWAVIGAMPRGDDYEQKRAAARREKLKTLSEEANTALNKYGWTDKEKSIARVPIQRAMEISLAELAQKQPVPANPIAAAPPQPGPQEAAPVAPVASTVPPSAAAAASAAATPKATSIHGKDSENRGQATGAANPPNAAPGTQPGPNATPAASPPSGASQPQPGEGKPTATPVQSPPGTPLPVPGATP
ncbi:MAG: hypothetical protein H0T95_00660 [Chthoniobacterales bacterium]|jgi:hypothetical protein|nr:hypothetical protein [Chthoniobacterales bacterium]